MSDQAQEKKERYKRVRTEFDDLDTEDKVLFIMEATVSTLARGVDEFGRAVSDEINNAFSRRAEKREKSKQSAGSPTGESSSTGPGSASSKSKAPDAPASDNGSEETGDAV